MECLADVSANVPILCVEGRGQFALAGEVRVYPEQVKEGVYADPALAGLTTANFRLRSGRDRARVRIQLSPGVAAEPGLADRFAGAMAPYVDAPIEVACETYDAFKSGMSLDYERKFPYVAGD